MTPEEKAKRYDGLIERLKDLKFAYRFSPLSDTIEEKFPELKESENENIDEKVRKALIKLVTNHASMDLFIEYDIHLDEALSWIEKQSKQSNNEDVDILQRFSFYSYKDEPNVLYLSNVFVNEEYRNKGIGTKILKVADKVSTHLKCNSIRLKTENGSNAESLYRKNGYKTLKEEENQIWLEKQIEQKSSVEMKTPEESLGIDSDTYNKIVDECVYGEEKPADNIEQKFHKGEWVVSPNGVYWHIDAVWNGRYEVTSDTGQSSNWPLSTNIYHLWTIKDAKDGDVLACNEEILLFKSYSVQGRISLYCWYNGQTNNFHSKEAIDTLLTTRNKIWPSTKEQRDLLFQKIHEAGYKWNSDEKKMEKIDNEIEIPFGAKDSELQEATYCIPKGFHAEIKGDEVVIKKGEKPIVWSKDDILHFRRCLGYIEACAMPRKDDVKWFKALEDRYTWKPNDEQMAALLVAIGDEKKLGSDVHKELYELYLQLKQF